MVGAQTTEQGDCSKFLASSFQVSVGSAGTSNKTVRVPKNFTLKAPGPGYTCGPAKIVKSTKFVTSDQRRTTQALSKFLAKVCDELNNVLDLYFITK